MPFRCDLRSFAAERPDELVIDDLRECLTRIETARDLLAQRPLTDALDERFGDRQGDIGLEQRHPYLAYRVADVLFGNTSAPRQLFHGTAKAATQRVKHTFAGIIERRTRSLPCLRAPKDC